MDRLSVHFNIKIKSSPSCFGAGELTWKSRDFEVNVAKISLYILNPVLYEHSAQTVLN